MDVMRKFRIEDAIMREMVDCYVNGKNDELEKLKDIYAAMHVAIGDSHEEALNKAENAVGVAYEFAFGG